MTQDQMERTEERIRMEVAERLEGEGLFLAGWIVVSSENPTDFICAAQVPGLKQALREASLQTLYVCSDCAEKEGEG